MGETGKLGTVLLADKALVMTALLDTVDLDRLIAFRGHAELSRVVKVERQNVRLGLIFVLAREKLAANSNQQTLQRSRDLGNQL